MQKRSTAFRAIELMPGIIVWSLIILPIPFSYFWPSAVAIYILAFDVMWVLRALYFSYFMIQTYRKMNRARRRDWKSMIANMPLDDPLVKDPKAVYHAVIFATFKEELETLEPSVNSVLNSEFDNKRTIIVLAGEERDNERFERVAGLLEDKYGDRLYAFLPFQHPDGIVGEVKGKGAGASFAGKGLVDFANKRNIPLEDIVMHIADADTCFDKIYFDAVTYMYCMEPNRGRRSFQPIPLYSNNIWHVPAFSRVVAWGASFWQMVEASRPWRLINFSTHAMSLKMLMEMNYWSTSVVNEDSRQYWRAYFAFSGDHAAIPVFVPVYMDAVLSDDWWKTARNQYLQKRRWAYGCEHLPYIILQSIKHKEISFWDKTLKIGRLLEGTISWSTASFYLAFFGWLPVIMSQEYRTTVLAVNYPNVARVLLSIAWIGLVISIYLSIRLLPPKPKGYKREKYFIMILEWALSPIVGIVFGSLPALESQTRLMLGKYLTFWVTEKKSPANTFKNVKAKVL